jgi:hypothetical protein
VNAPEEEKKEARKGQKTSFIRPAPARGKRANIGKQVFIHKEPFLKFQTNIENLPDFVNPPFRYFVNVHYRRRGRREKPVNSV